MDTEPDSHARRTDQPGTDHRPGFSLPRRSRADRKIAGVAGGLGRALGVDPILIRVAFVVLALFGGSGVLLYCVGWLVMPADGDEASAVQALAGRGRSSVSPALAVVLVIVALASAGSAFSWGIPFWPVAIAAAVVFLLLARRRAMGCRSRQWTGRDGQRGWGPPPRWNDPESPDREGSTGRPPWGPAGWTGRSDWQARPDWSARADEFAERVTAWGTRVGEQASRWAGQWGGSGHAPYGSSTSATATPATGPDTDHDVVSGDAAAPGAAEGASAGSAGAPTAEAPQADTPSPEELLSQGRRTPPAWDPLGAAPFAWDLPEPGPDPTAPAGMPTADADTPARTRGSAIGRLFLGVALLAGGSLTAGVLLGWWSLHWSAIAGITLAVVGAGLIVASLRGAGGRHLIGPGVFLAVLTLGLTVTGISGTNGFGAQAWAPTSAAEVNGSSYSWSVGHATLNLSELTVPQGETVRTSVTLKAGQATVIVPKDVAVDATCRSRLGGVDCLGVTGNGVRVARTAHQDGEKSSGTITLDVHNNAGQVVVRRG